jgi:hypothetical protein
MGDKNAAERLIKGAQSNIAARNKRFRSCETLDSE